MNNEMFLHGKVDEALDLKEQENQLHMLLNLLLKEQ